MNEYLNRQLDQISKLISGLKDTDVDVEKLIELDQSLEMLSQGIKTARLEGKDENNNVPNLGLKQDAVFYFNLQYHILRFVGSYENIYTKGNQENLYEVKALFTEEGFATFKEKTKLLLNTSESQSFQTEIISKNGLLLPVNILLEKISFGQWAGAIAAGMVFSNQRPSDLENYREILMENLPGLDVYLFDTHFRYVLAGGQEKEKFGYTNADFTGKTLFEVYDEKTQKRLYPFYRNALDGKESEGEVRIKNRVYFISATPVLSINNQVVGGALISQDVTNEKEVEKKLIKAKRQAEEADKAKSLFLANMSHEVRTPLNAIIGFTGLLNKTDLSPKQKKFSRLINQSSEHLLSVVNEILFLFKLGMGKIYLEKVPFSIHELIKNVHESMLMRANEKELTFTFNIHSGIPETFLGDAFRLKQILMNLIGNAINFTDEGIVSLQVFCEHNNQKNTVLRFEVEDTGIGIPKKDLGSIFDEFSQSHLGHEKKRKGAGLGLTIVRTLVNLLNGRIHVESIPGKGSKFSVVIPFEKTDTPVSPVSEKEFTEGAFDLLHGKRILFADDDEYNILLGELILKDWKVDFTIACDGAEALDILQKEHFDAVLLDIQMPFFTGAQVIEKIKSDPSNINYHTKMLAVTANIMRNDIKKYLDKGFDGYVLKPFREETLYNKICNLLNIHIPSETEGSVDELSTESVTEFDNFDTSQLVKTAGEDLDFYNHMINTFISGARTTSEGLRTGVKTKNWKEIGNKAHKAIPSFNYFGLKELAKKLVNLEDLTLRQNKTTTSVEKMAISVASDIETIIGVAERARILKEENR